MTEHILLLLKLFLLHSCSCMITNGKSYSILRKDLYTYQMSIECRDKSGCELKFYSQHCFNSSFFLIPPHAFYVSSFQDMASTDILGSGSAQFSSVLTKTQPSLSSLSPSGPHSGGLNNSRSSFVLANSKGARIKNTPVNSSSGFTFVCNDATCFNNRRLYNNSNNSCNSAFCPHCVVGSSAPIPEFRDAENYWSEQGRHVIRPKPRR